MPGDSSAGMTTSDNGIQRKERGFGLSAKKRSFKKWSMRFGMENAVYMSAER
jgi:hypothetical protein